MKFCVINKREATHVAFVYEFCAFHPLPFQKIGIRVEEGIQDPWSLQSQQEEGQEKKVNDYYFFFYFFAEVSHD